MGLISRFDLSRIIQDFGCKVFIETGTGTGDGLAHACAFPFERILSVEVVDELAERARARFAANDRVDIVVGQSSSVLEQWLSTVPGDAPVLFWLDAHFPGADFQLAAYDSETDERVRLPLETELARIRKLRPGVQDVFLIDDLRIYCDGPFDGGNIPDHAQTLPPDRRNTAFLRRHLGDYRLLFSFRDEGYVLAIPPDIAADVNNLFVDGFAKTERAPLLKECGKAVLRRISEPGFVSDYFVGRGLDVGGAPDPLGIYKTLFPMMGDVDVWDWEQGDAQYLAGVADESYDFVHSSHCLEHMRDPVEAIANWFRIVKPGGHLVVLVPDEDLYEQGVWPSTFNGDHKVTFSILKSHSWSPVSHNLLTMLEKLGERADIKSLRVLDATFRYDLPRFDQTMTPVGECAIELVVRKRPLHEVSAGGRLPAGGELSEDRAYLLTGPVPGALHPQLDALASLSTERAQVIEGLKAEVAKLRASLEQSRASLEESEANIAAILQSSSWRLTGPLRATISRMRRLIPGRR